jgi:hypothetical protein
MIVAPERRAFNRGLTMFRMFATKAKPDGPQGHGLHIEMCTKFFRTLYVQGSSERDVVGARVLSKGVIDVSLVASENRFSAQFLFREEPTGAETIVLTLRGGATVRFVPLEEGDKDNGRTFDDCLHTTFVNLLGKLDNPRMVDIGGRARSRIDRSQHFPGVDVCVFDVLPGDNVDVVGDAHMMSALLPPESFDAVYSVSVFEHIFMPWKVATEMNAVMKTGAVGFIQSHQTVGMHDMPWDFWRYSDNAWDALFNEYTGFRIIGRQMFKPGFILPFMLVRGKEDAERAAGYEGSAVLIEKTGPASVAWDVPHSVIATMYPA